MYPVGCDRHEHKDIGGHLKNKGIVGFKSRFHHSLMSRLLTDCTFNKFSNLSGLNHDPEDKRQVDEIEGTEDVLGQPYVCPLTTKRTCRNRMDLKSYPFFLDFPSSTEKDLCVGSLCCTIMTKIIVN